MDNVADILYHSSIMLVILKAIRRVWINLATSHECVNRSLLKSAATLIDCSIIIRVDDPTGLDPRNCLIRVVDLDLKSNAKIPHYKESLLMIRHSLQRHNRMFNE